MFKYIKKDKDINILFLEKISIFKKEKYKSSTFYFCLSVPIFKIRLLVNEKKVFCFGILIYKKKTKQTEKINPYAKGYDYIYTSYHTGEMYYLCNLIKNNFNKFKDIKIVSCFKYLKQILELFDFSEEWIQEHFIYTPEFIPSCMYYANKNGNIEKIIETDYEKGLLFNKKQTKKHISKLIAELTDNDQFEYYPLKGNYIDNKDKLALIFPESIFNGNLDKSFLSLLVKNLLKLNYKVFINSKKDNYQNLLNKNVKQIFLSFKDTYKLALNCELVIGVRSGFFDCLQCCAKGKTKLHIIYNNYCYPCYNHMRNFKDFCLNSYSLEAARFANNIYEYKWLNDNEKAYQNFIDQIFTNINGGYNA